MRSRDIAYSLRFQMLQVRDGGFEELIMVGENMGTIPPNTALMIVYANDKRYQLYLTSDETKNAMVRFIYEKPAATVHSQ